jgi:hypothetical protein
MTTITTYFKTAPKLKLNKNIEQELKSILNKNNKEFNVKNFIFCYFLLEQPTTLYAKTDVIQCFYGRNRSLKDLYCLTKYYFPTVTLRQVELVLKSLIFSAIIDFMHCSDVKDIVFFTNERIEERNKYKMPVIKLTNGKYDIEIINAELKEVKDFFGRTGYSLYGKKLQKKR